MRQSMRQPVSYDRLFFAISKMKSTVKDVLQNQENEFKELRGRIERLERRINLLISVAGPKLSDAGTPATRLIDTLKFDDEGTHNCTIERLFLKLQRFIYVPRAFTEDAYNYISGNTDMSDYEAAKQAIIELSANPQMTVHDFKDQLDIDKKYAQIDYVSGKERHTRIIKRY